MQYMMQANNTAGTTPGFFESFLPGIAAAGTIGMGHALAAEMGQTGEDAANQMGALAGQLQGDTSFKGYGVTTGLGTSSVAADGSTTLGVGPDAALQQAGMAGQAGGMDAMGAAITGLQNQNAVNHWMEQGANQMGQYHSGLHNTQAQGLLASQRAQREAMMPTAEREQQIYDRAMAMQQPGLDSAQAAQQANEFAMGRGGVRGSQFGGTAEDAAMARARAQASNEASFQAMGQAQQERMNAAQMSSMFGSNALAAQQAGANLSNQLAQLGVQTKGMTDNRLTAMGQLGQGLAGVGQSQYSQSFMPMQQQMAAMQLAQGNAGMAQSGQFTGAGYAAQLGLGGIQAQINAQKAASELYGNMFGSIMNNAGEVGTGVDTILGQLGII